MVRARSTSSWWTRREPRPAPRHDRMSGTIGAFVDRYRTAICSAQLRANLLRFQRLYAAGRRVAFDRYAQEGAAVGVVEPTFAAQRQKLSAAKDEALGDRPALLARFIANAEAAGSTVFVARTAEDAVGYIVDLCKQRGATLF